MERVKIAATLPDRRGAMPACATINMRMKGDVVIRGGHRSHPESLREGTPSEYE